jgi:hypothetical protein
MIDVLTDNEAFQRYAANYRAIQRAKKTYYENNKERILAKKREKYAAKKVAADPRLDPPASNAV